MKIVRPVSLAPPSDGTVRRAVRVISMVHELHKAGYQHIRISPGMSPSGMSWRCNITYAANVEADGYTIRNFDSARGLVARYTSADGALYFQWQDGASLTARQMGQRFIEKFPLIAEKGSGRDWAYAGWLTEVLGRAEQGRPRDVLVLYADYPIDRDELRLWAPPVFAEADEQRSRH